MIRPDGLGQIDREEFRHIEARRLKRAIEAIWPSEPPERPRSKERPTTEDHRLANLIAFGPPSSDERLDWLDGIGHEWLDQDDDRIRLLAGGFAVRVVRLERGRRSDADS